jgi:hypothetical protein
MMEVAGAKTRREDPRVLAKTLFQAGLDRGLSPDQSALRVSEAKLPASITDEGQEEFKEWLVEAYRESLDQQVRQLRQRMGLEDEDAERGNV